MSKKAIRGVNVFSVTPTDANESIDHKRFNSHASMLVEKGVHGLTLFGSTGSNGSFTAAEKMAALETVLEAVRGRVPVMMGVGSITTAESRDLVQHAERVGADAVLTVPLNYWAPTPRELLYHYESLAGATSLPFWIYNNPPLAGVDITPDLVSKLAERKANIVGIKESSGDLSRVLTIPGLTGGKVGVGAGYESFVVEPVALGAQAWLNGIGNIAPGLCVRLWDRAKAGDFSAAFKIAADLFPLAELIVRHGHVRVVAEALDLVGETVGCPRKPLLPLEPADREELARAVAFLSPKAPRISAAN
jgi:4-hydroxy-tetrahydrodipicolinate synthase